MVSSPPEMLVLGSASLPLLICLGVAAVAAVAAAVFWLGHSYTLNAGRKELASYKDRVVALSDKIDALKERHKILPYSDKDFVVPMAGETLAAYQQIAASLERYRQDWLKLMDVWEQAQAQLQSAGLFASGQVRVARRSIRDAGAQSKFEALLRECEAPLDQIEQSHQNVGESLQQFRQEDEQFGAQLDSIASASLALAPYQPDRSAARTLVEQAHESMPADPLTSLRCLAEARRKLAEINQRAVKILEHVRTAQSVSTGLSAAQAMVTQRRSQGFLLREDGANPDPLLAVASEQQVIAHDALNEADEAVAGAALAKASGLIKQANEGVERHVAARSRCEAQIPAGRHDVRRLADVHAATKSQHAELLRDFAAETWLGVAENSQRAQASLETAQRLVEQAAQCATANVQQFLLACKSLDQAAEIHKSVETELAAVGKRLHELVEMRGACTAQIGQLRGLADRAQHLLQSSSADRALANERFRTARAGLDRLAEETRAPRPDWARLKSRASEIQSELERVEKLAREDMQLAQQAANEIAETERVIRETKAFHELECTPDLSLAESQLAQARGCASAQGYEEAIRLANESERIARAAHSDAISRAQRRKQEIEARRRAEQAAAAAALVAPLPALQAEADEPVLSVQREV